MSALAIYAALGVAAAPRADEPRQSLEGLLQQAERAAAQRQGELRPKVEAIMAELDGAPGRSPTATSEAKKRALAALGSEALPLIVPYLDPGDDEADGAALRSLIAAEVVAESPTPAVTDPLIRLSLSGSILGRMRALFALRATTEPERVLPAVTSLARGQELQAPDPRNGSVNAKIAPPEDIEEALRKAAEEAARGADSGGVEEESTAEPDADTGRGRRRNRSFDVEALRQEAYVTVAHLDCDAARAFLRGELLDQGGERRNMALRALGASPASSKGTLALELLNSEDAPEIAPSIAAFYAMNEELLADDDHAEALAEVARSPGTPEDARIALFDLMRVTDARLPSSAKRDIERSFADAASSDVRRAALLLLARAKDRGAKRELLRDFDDRLGRGRNLPLIYAERARLYHDIGDWGSAVKDWRTAMKLDDEDRTSFRPLRGAFVGIARSLARMKKFREAGDYLKISPLSLRQLQALASDRDFKEMAESRYRDAFHLD